VESKKTEMIVMSPMLAIVVKCISQDAILDNDWKVRQAAVNQIRIAIERKNDLEYYKVGVDA
jgi:hypothetical protein